MSTIEADLATELEQGERLRKLGIDQEELDREILEDIDAVFGKRNEHARLRAILFDVIDAGDNGIPWGWNDPFEVIADEQRTRFVDAVIEKLRRG